MKFTIITLFPEFVEKITQHSIVKRAIKKGLVSINLVNPRDFSQKQKIDETVFGGGDGMLMMIEPIVKAIRSIEDPYKKVYLMGPRGPKFNQTTAKKFANSIKHVVFIAGHYEGIDSRIKNYIDGEISIGDFILTGGELPAMMMADAIIRLLPGVIKEGSHLNESFENNLLEHDHYTQPREFEGNKVPEILLSGDHGKIRRFREENSREITIKHLLKIKGE